jgi:hypothetical protein
LTPARRWDSPRHGKATVANSRKHAFNVVRALLLGQRTSESIALATIGDNDDGGEEGTRMQLNAQDHARLLVLSARRRPLRWLQPQS